MLTDLYELTMANAYWQAGIAEQEAIFHMSFRKSPFGGGFTVACGLLEVMQWLEQLHFTADDLAYLATLKGSDGHKLFKESFLHELHTFQFDCSVDAPPEGTVMFPHEPLLRVRGPIWQAQLVESAVLNLLNFHSLIATKAARMRLAAAADQVIEFGLRRAHGVDGSLGASRAAYVGGCDGTSNVLAGQVFGIPVRGTHAHSWVMAFDDEATAFAKYAAAMPNNSILLVDTYDTLRGVQHALEVGHILRKKGYKLDGIRLDSGDLAWLSIEARRMLDAQGFQDARIVASSDLDERLILSLKLQGAKIDVWGVGTKLATAFDEPALGGVYKLSAIHTASGWQHRLKLSEQAAKVSIPGMLQVRRFMRDGDLRGDMIYDELLGAPEEPCMVDPLDPTRERSFDAQHRSWDVLVPIFRAGKRVFPQYHVHAARQHCLDQLALFSPEVKRFDNPHQYPVGLEQQLFALRHRLIREARRK